MICFAFFFLTVLLAGMTLLKHKLLKYYHQSKNCLDDQRNKDQSQDIGLVSLKISSILKRIVCVEDISKAIKI